MRDGNGSGLKFETDVGIGQKGAFCRGLKLKLLRKQIRFNVFC